jgi:hypothetical protein
MLFDEVEGIWKAKSWANNVIAAFILRKERKEGIRK